MHTQPGLHMRSSKHTRIHSTHACTCVDICMHTYHMYAHTCVNMLVGANHPCTNSFTCTTWIHKPQSSLGAEEEREAWIPELSIAVSMVIRHSIPPRDLNPVLSSGHHCPLTPYRPHARLRRMQRKSHDTKVWLQGWAQGPPNTDGHQPWAFPIIRFSSPHAHTHVHVLADIHDAAQGFRYAS